MAARKGGLGKGLDGLFPMYNTQETSAGETRTEKPETGNKTGKKAADKAPEKKSASKSGSKTGEKQQKQVKSEKPATAKAQAAAKQTAAKKAEKPSKAMEAAPKKAGKPAKAAEAAPKKAEKPAKAAEAAPKKAEKPAKAAEAAPKKPVTSPKQPETAPEEPEGTPVMVRLSRIEPNPEQPRRQFDEEALKELSDSIKEFGVLQPLVVKRNGDRFEIIAGERRWRASRMAGLKEVPVIIKDLSPKEILEVSLVENLQREDLNAIEEAEAYDKLMTEFQMTQEQAAKRVSKSRTAVANAVRLLNLDPAVRNMVVENLLSAGHARALLALSDPEQQKKAAEMVVSEGLSVRETEKLVKNFGKPEKKKTSTAEDPTLALIYHEMEENLKSALGTKVHVNRQGEKKGKIEIEYYSREELERIYDLLRSAQ